MGCRLQRRVVRPFALSVRSGLGVSAWAIVAWLALAGMQSHRAAAEDEVAKGSSSREDRTAAVRGIPFEKLSEDARTKVNQVLSNVAIYRRMPIEMVQCDPELYLFLVNRPDTVVSIWEILGISEVAMRQTGRNTYRADDGAGTEADFEFLHRAHDCHVVLAKGLYKGPLFSRTVKGNCLMVLRSGFVKNHQAPGYIITHRLDVFCEIENAGANVLARTFQPLVTKVADRNFTEISDFISTLSRKVERDQAWVNDIAQRMDNVHPTVRENFVRIGQKLSASAPTPNSSRQALGATSPVRTSVVPPIVAPSPPMLAASSPTSSPSLREVEETPTLLTLPTSSPHRASPAFSLEPVSPSDPSTLDSDSAKLLPTFDADPIDAAPVTPAAPPVRNTLPSPTESDGPLLVSPLSGLRPTPRDWDEACIDRTVDRR